MPCSDAGQDEYWNKETYGIYTSSAHIAAMVACEATRVLHETGLISTCSELLNKWYKEHQKHDASCKEKP